nr:hypothetical protein [Chloroflexota bacterium]
MAGGGSSELREISHRLERLEAELAELKRRLAALEHGSLTASAKKKKTA